jgi:hypothetical protein
MKNSFFLSRQVEWFYFVPKACQHEFSAATFLGGKGVTAELTTSNQSVFASVQCFEQFNLSI